MSCLSVEKKEASEVGWGQAIDRTCRRDSVRREEEGKTGPKMKPGQGHSDQRDNVKAKGAGSSKEMGRGVETRVRRELWPLHFRAVCTTGI